MCNSSNRLFVILLITLVLLPKISSAQFLDPSQEKPDPIFEYLENASNPFSYEIDGNGDHSNVELIGSIYNNWGYAYNVAIYGDYVYVANGEAGLRIVNIFDPDNPIEVGFYDIDGLVRDVVVSSNYAYVATGYDGLRVVDISDPANPNGVGSCYLDGYAIGIVVAGEYAYVAGYYDGLRVIDISDPTNPNEVGFYDTDGTVYDVDISGDYAYVADRHEGLRVINISDPTNTVEIGFYNTNGLAYGVNVSGDYAYIADYDEGLRVIDISDPANPNEVDYFDTRGWAHSVKVYGDYAYVADHYEGLIVIDISDPTYPLETGAYDTNGEVLGVDIAGNYAYLADNWEGLRVINIVDSANPYEVSFYDGAGIASDVDISGNYAYVANYDTGLRVIENTDPTNPIEVGFYDTDGTARVVVVTGNYAYVADGDAGLRVIDISDPTNPIEAGFFDTDGSALGVVVAGNYAYVADDDAGLRVIDISDHTNLVEVGFFLTQETAYDVDISGDYAFVADLHDGLRVIDVSDPANPNEVSACYIDGLVTEVDISGNYAYVIASDVGLSVIDISDPINPIVAGSFDTEQHAKGVYISGDFAYLANGGAGLRVINISDPTNPNEVGFYDTNGNALGIDASDGYIYLADYYHYSIFEILWSSDHFTPVDPTNSPYSLIVDSATIDNINLSVGDEIGVFDSDLCVGSASVTGDWPLNVTVWEGDPPNDIAGFTAGNTMLFKIWSVADESEYVATPTYTVGNGTFGLGDYAQLSLVSIVGAQPPSSFNLLFPSDNDVIATNIVTLSWDESIDPDPGDVLSYIVWYANDIDFTDADSVEVSATTYDLSGLMDDTSYWWKVRAQDTNTSGTWSTETSSFSVAIPEAPEEFALIGPNDLSVIEADSVVFNWFASSDNDPEDVISYHLEWSINADFETFESLVVDGVTATINDMTDDGQYFWRVKAVDTYELFTYGLPGEDGWSFTIEVPNSPLSFNLVSPVDSLELDTLSYTFIWNETTDPDPEDTINYQLAISMSEIFDDSLTAYYHPHSDTSFVVPYMADDTDFWWRVLAEDTNTDGTYSDSTSFFHTAMPEAPHEFEMIECGMLFTEAEDSVDVSVTWDRAYDPDPDSEELYAIYIDLDETMENQVLLMDNINVPASNDTFFVWSGRVAVADLPGGDGDDFYMTVHALDNNSEGTWASNIVDTQLSPVFEDPWSDTPVVYEIASLYPNPFNPTLTVVIALPITSDLRVVVYNIMGREIAELTNRQHQTGYHNFMFDGAGLSSGIYFVHAVVPEKLNQVQKIVLMK